MALKNRIAGTVAAGILLAGAAHAAPPSIKARALTQKSSITRLEQPIETQRERAFAALRAGDRVAALAAFQAATIEAPQDPHVWQLAGDLQFAQDDRAGAVETWAAGVEQLGDDPVLLQRLLRGAVEVGDYARAAQAAGGLAALATQEGEVLHFGGAQSELATLAGDFTQAEEAARRLIKRFPHAVEGRLALAYMHLQAGELSEAEDLYREILAVAPEHTTALNNLGNIHYLQRDLDGAARHFEAILSASEATPYAESLALSNLAELFQLQGAFKQAEALYRQAIEARPEGAWGYMGLAALLDVTGRHDAAVDTMIDGWERDSNRMTRLNMHFFQPEWQWQRDALIAEIEGDADQAEALWMRVQTGDVKHLHKAATWHLDTLATP